MDSTTPEYESAQQIPSIETESPLPPPPSLEHTSARLSSSPASSPRIVASPPMRKVSVHPEMSMMDKGTAPGADFLDNASTEDDSAWEDDNGTRDCSEVEGLGIRNLLLRNSLLSEDEEGEETRTQRRTSNALLPFDQLSTHDSGIATGGEEPRSAREQKATNRAHEVSLRRFDSVRLVHNRGSGSDGHTSAPDSIISSNGSETASAAGHPKPSVELRGGQSEGNRSLTRFKWRHRRNTSESLRADSILNAHAITMQALEALSPNASFSRAHGYLAARSHHSLPYVKPRSASLSDHEHVLFSPLSLQSQQFDPDRPAHLPAHFVKTPYPFTAKKEFPKPKTRPRQHGFADGISHAEYAYDDKEGRHILGLVPSEGEYDLRSRLERNEDAQGVCRTERKSSDGVRETVVWLSLRRRRNAEPAHHLEHIVIPSSLTTTSPDWTGGKTRKQMGRRDGNDTVDFDDKFFARQLRSAYKKLAGPWFLRLLSARRLRYIQVGSVGVWSGSPCSISPPGNSASRHNDAVGAKLLAARDGLDISFDAQSPFTEHKLMHLFRNPKAGKARYTWVHWARRMSASNAAPAGSASAKATAKHARARARAHSLDTSTSQRNLGASLYTPTPSLSLLHPQSAAGPDTLATIQFVHAFSPLRILAVLAVLLALSVLAALLWIFLGKSGWAGMTESREKAERVGSAMAVGGLALALEGVGFLAWVVGSWMWA